MLLVWTLSRLAGGRQSLCHFGTSMLRLPNQQIFAARKVSKKRQPSNPCPIIGNTHVLERAY